ncbi:uncharacterized protein B0P05DRAFT_337820 [Gilbertella persicaria]|uniref:uncharacterized protein n=1 Tax=Gilbertella persicaria TaxID=101096 RepID=UPI00221F486F|nr:uncharacterized protein B0P05DRAFT_337820 [Gilbertella persicaria]KAI8048756.1 hypothetical protein B0P05DRAFT_337820 [Gilbertella persicaria]
MKGYYFIMDNARIHKEIQDILNKRNRDYKCEKLKDTEILQERIVDVANEVPIQHSWNQFDNRLNHSPISNSQNDYSLFPILFQTSLIFICQDTWDSEALCFCRSFFASMHHPCSL